MKRLIAVLVFSLASALHAAGALETMEAEGLAIKGAPEFNGIYQAFLNRGFPNQHGHTMAAAVLAGCRIGDKEKVNEMFAILEEMSLYQRHEDPQLRVIGANPKAFAQITYSAAVLTCKRGGLDIPTLVRKLATVFRAVLIDGKVNLPHNVVVAADLLAPQP